MYAGFYEEGDKCPECREGILYYPQVQNCTCHINPPCSACTDRELEGDKCGYQHYDSSAETESKGSFGGTLVFEHRTCTEALDKRDVFSKNACQ
jgi:hypothetical protein